MTRWVVKETERNSGDVYYYGKGYTDVGDGYGGLLMDAVAVHGYTSYRAGASGMSMVKDDNVYKVKRGIRSNYELIEVEV